MRPIMLMGHERSLTQVKYNREGDLIFTSGKDNVASVWYAMNGERLGTLEGHNGSIWSIDVDQHTEYAVTGSADFSVKVWRVRDGSIAHSWDTRTPVRRVEFSPTGDRVLAVLDNVMNYAGAIVVFSVTRDANNQITGFNSGLSCEILTQEGCAPVLVASWSYDGKYIVAGHQDGKISKYNGVTGECLEIKDLHKQRVSDIQFSLDRTYFLTTSRDSYANLVDVETFEVLKTYETDCPLNSGCITPLKEFVILGGGQDARDVTTTSAREGKFEAKFYHKLFQVEIGRVDDHFGPVNYIAVSPQGTSYASGGEDGFVRLHHFDKSYFDFKFDVEKSADAQKKVDTADR
ncbi:ADR264Cp [Eremothecium gossypii ATCC 10895]|uniref:Eukaryotic translation initiation factor 3 subunit I n=1 Tax=Eremothecium gossypii (strain ATCC 10895 / CBS 109.51 / FGSC 9923 / NRRL Y-1056) TaxID=284811 RepID=EIF3I_EREGS|nr:ADR264Cp [Eremothecium gossypii ATCC 10895]Q759L2.1 RecName: Full=Eukaryotic translation initiation factor 3 subunit I; Short=eIF3i; AltName: Full=Eukaryotic translation initiation factor 3 39 kDa subunit homolog; Short=eIF-3 39 kDa subunit homolog [Eremothecium gossypii ATCC 10895]AAS52184.1 ADR264Cp [Eremothecium gossypii ATCC 10895]AEY96483.1 FADR264Cp [Eremothecium gossypii FDAG1]